ncbi:Hypothetical protein NTJ_15352 [Nesidiocoris tenuis]|uniref:Kinesin motor domain-containing protein n=1 Tax=Nesidiocoris tenuis TaxID=355587 RepID=A0ABN7BHK7_9HEMI|nr:Hypothetical protein NTJ_15352 [Nesidiocoris tenuis]
MSRCALVFRAGAPANAKRGVLTGHMVVIRKPSRMSQSFDLREFARRTTKIVSARVTTLFNDVKRLH